MILIFIILLCSIALIHSLRIKPRVSTRLQQPVFAGAMEEGSLVKLSTYSEDAQWLGTQITKWLNVEWIGQPVHEKIGSACSDLYKVGRESGITDLGEMLMEIGTGLERVSFDDPEGDAYVNAWDVANKCSDLLMLRMDNELCDCMGDMSMFQQKEKKEKGIDAELMDELASNLAGTFQRYKWMARFLDDEEDKNDTAIVLALVLGFRSEGKEIVFDATKSAYGWQESNVYAMLDSQDKAMGARMERDLPEDEESTDIAIEPVVGIEMYKQMRDPERGASEWDLRRVLLAKLLYVHGFMTQETFPAETTFIPTNLAEEDEEDEDN